MPSFYELVFADTSFGSDNTKVCCPFPHHDTDGNEYFETNPSLSVHIEKGVHQCFSCGISGTEVQFISQYLGVPTQIAYQLKNLFHNTMTTSWSHFENYLWQSEQGRLILKQLHIEPSVAKQLRIGYQGGDTLEFPVFMYRELMNYNSYNPLSKPKYKVCPNRPVNLITPFDLWQKEKRQHVTYICAGEKDMAIARSKGFNAITITGGEGALPKLFLHEFKDLKVVIVYDNDETGKKSALKLASFLKPVTQKIVIVDLAETCKNIKEDLWDYFIKYQKTPRDLVTLVKNSKEFTDEDAVLFKSKTIPKIPLIKAPNFKSLVQSDVQIVASVDTSFSLITGVNFTKYKMSEEEKYNTLPLNHTFEWFFDTARMKEMLYLIDSNLKEKDVIKNLYQFARVPPKEFGMRMDILTTMPIYKCVVTDSIESFDERNYAPLELEAYVIGHKLESGKKCRITYNLLPHPLDGQKNVLIITEVEDSMDSVSSFKLTPETIEHLKVFQTKGTAEQRLNEFVERSKGIIEADYPFDLVRAIDLWFHTPIHFSYGKQVERAYLDMLIVTESRIGKSSTARKLRETYQLASIVSLAGTQATTPALIGGTQKKGGSNQTKAGYIPQMNKNGIIFEELAKCHASIIKELTEIRSSQRVRISRVSGNLDLPAYVRFLTLSNTKVRESGVSQPIDSYPNGVEIVQDLIGNVEDIARYDYKLILGTRGTTHIDPFYEPMEPFPLEALKTRIRWIWSRTAKDIVINKAIYEYVIRISNKLMATYNSFIKIFGPETWKKITRLAIAIAGYLVSSDAKFEKIIVTEEHIDLAASIFVSAYDNPTFKFKEYVEQERKYSVIDDEGVALLQKVFEQHTSFIMYLENSAGASRPTLQAISGLSSDDFATLMQTMVRFYFLQFIGNSIVPTQRFRQGLTKLNRDARLKRIEEVSLNV